MTFGEFVKQCQDLLEKHPEAKDYTTIYSIDAEGNAYHEVYYEPGLGHFDGKEEEWESLENLNSDEYDEEDRECKPINSVIIN